MTALTVGNKIALRFSGVTWTGGSNIHKSKAFRFVVRAPAQDEILTRTWQAGIAQQLLARWSEWFPDVKWLVSPAEFAELFLTDMAFHLEGKGNAPSLGKLKNPNTGNEFHRVGMCPEDELLCGYRIWKEAFKDPAAPVVQHSDADDGTFGEAEAEAAAAGADSLGYYSFGCRVRWAAAEATFAKHREHVEEQMHVAKEAFLALTNEIPQATVEQTVKLQNCLYIEE